MLNQLLRPALLIFGVTISLWLLFRVIISFYKKKQGQELSLKQELIAFLSFTYITCVLIITTVPIPMTRSYDQKLNRINLIPLVNTIKGFIGTLSPEKNFMIGHSLENIVGNIVLFVPLDIFLPLLSNRLYSLRKVVLLSVFFSLCIELVQLISRQFGVYRSVDIDDIILNTLGACIGFICLGLLMKSGIITRPKSA